LFQTLCLGIFFSSSRRKEKKTIEKKKCKERKELSFKLSFCLLTFGPAFALLFQTLCPGIFFFSRRKKEKKTIEKKKIQRRERAHFQALALPSHFWFLLLAFCFCPFVSSTFSLASSSSQA
jgi:hypothetical protein